MTKLSVLENHFLWRLLAVCSWPGLVSHSSKYPPTYTHIRALLKLHFFLFEIDLYLFEFELRAFEFGISIFEFGVCF